MSDTIQSVESHPKTENPKILWERAVRSFWKNRCANCGIDNDVYLRLKMVVPIEAGGQYVVSNGFLVCRACEMATASVKGPKEAANRPLNFWVSRQLHESIQTSIKSGFNSIGGLVRYLMNMYLEDQARFTDLTNYQDQGSDVKLNVWVDPDVYGGFQKLVSSKGSTVTDTLRSLILLYQSEIASKVSMES